MLEEAIRPGSKCDVLKNPDGSFVYGPTTELVKPPKEFPHTWVMNSENASMHALNKVGRFFLGAVIAFFMPALFGLAISALVLTFDKDAGALTGFGPACTPEQEVQTASPNGRFIAISIRMACEDVSDPKNSDIRIFVASTRLDRAAHIATIQNGKNELPKISWASNATVNIPNQYNSALKFAKGWCGIQPSIIVSSP